MSIFFLVFNVKFLLVWTSGLQNQWILQIVLYKVRWDLVLLLCHMFLRIWEKDQALHPSLIFFDGQDKLFNSFLALEVSLFPVLQEWNIIEKKGSVTWTMAAKYIDLCNKLIELQNSHLKFTSCKVDRKPCLEPMSKIPDQTGSWSLLGLVLFIFPNILQGKTTHS